MIIDKIIAEKKKDLRELKSRVSQKKLEQIVVQGKGHEFKKALRGENIAIIAEAKKASPSKGIFREDFDPVSLAKTYEKGGAKAISVITEEKFFLGHSHYLTAVKKAVTIPVLRKDFIIDPYQIYETAALGGDALLLLACVLNKEELSTCLRECRALGLASLVEVHDERELDTVLSLGVEIVGINNRDLKTFTTSTEVTKNLASLIPSEVLIVTESGISKREDLSELAPYFINGALIGETLVVSEDPLTKLKEFSGIKRRIKND